MRDEVPQIETAARDLTAYVAGLLAGRRAVPRPSDRHNTTFHNRPRNRPITRQQRSGRERGPVAATGRTSRRA